MTENEQVHLAGHVDPQTWTRLCADDRFLTALATDDAEYAEVVLEILTSDWDNASRPTTYTL